MKFSRRDAMKAMALAGVIIPSPMRILEKGETVWPEELTILFQGDSITDAGRDRGHYYANDSRGMGSGYVRHIATEMLGLHPAKKVKIYNRGISGNKVFQLASRWNEDCLQLNPDVLSILIGVNDFWHTLTHNYKGSAESYFSDLRDLLIRTTKNLPDTRLIIGEPFVILDGSAIDPVKWKNEFPKYQAFARELAIEFNAGFVAYQELFDKALQIAPASYWVADGVHPSMAGDYLMANAWLECFLTFFE